MSATTPRILCIGLANVDIIANVGEDFLSAHNIGKGVTNTLDACTTGAILSKIENPVFYPGGCAANTACGIAGFGVPVRFTGKTGEDSFGEIFRDGFAHTPNLVFDTPPFAQKMTSVCLTLVTPDKERSFALCTDTAGWFIGPDDLPEAEDGARVYLEANTALMRTGENRSLLEDAAEKYRNRHLILNLNDRDIVDRCRPVIGSLFARGMETCFIGQMEEFFALFQTRNFDAACDRAKATGKHFAITSGPNGVYLLHEGKIEHVPANAVPASHIVNTVGAGDQFAGGFVAGLAMGMPLREACVQGVNAATAILQQIDARPKFRKSA
jgi:sugar/nucleoside kinase (ribokinase family)